MPDNITCVPSTSTRGGLALIFDSGGKPERLETPAGAILAAYRGSIAHNMYVPSSDPDSIDDIDFIGFVIAEPVHSTLR